MNNRIRLSLAFAIILLCPIGYYILLVWQERLEETNIHGNARGYNKEIEFSFDSDLRDLDFIDQVSSIYSSVSDKLMSIYPDVELIASWIYASWREERLTVNRIAFHFRAKNIADDLTEEDYILDREFAAVKVSMELEDIRPRVHIIADDLDSSRFVDIDFDRFLNAIRDWPLEINVAFDRLTLSTQTSAISPERSWKVEYFKGKKVVREITIKVSRA
jgi:hypothetical protein